MNDEHQYRWETVPHESGDIDVLLIGEEHTDGSDCECKPKVTVVGSNLVVTHNAFDHREILDEAEEIVGIKPRSLILKRNS
jgi:hypothetical protein